MVGSRYRVKDLSAGGFIFWVLFWLIVLLVVWQPSLSSELANFLGVGRGADLVIYVSIALLFYLIFRLTVKAEKIERNITTLAREIALKEKEK